MGFFSELKSDLSQAVNTLVPDEKAGNNVNAGQASESADAIAKADEGDKKIDLDSMLNKLDDIKIGENEEEKSAEKVAEPVKEVKPEPEVKQDIVKSDVEEVIAETEKKETDDVVDDLTSLENELSTEDMVNNAVNSAVKTLHAAEAVEKNVEAKEEASKAVDNVSAVYETSDNKAQNDMEMAATLNTAAENNNGGIENMSLDQKTPTDEVASITEGMVVNGDIETTGSLDIVGKVVGNVSSLGKLNVSGEIEGDSKAAEFYADSARIAGEVRSDGSVKVGQSTVIIGNIYATSAVIAGAVRGDIDVHGPVVLDTTAIVMGNIKSQSVQINNGAVIEGMCSQAYAEVNPSAFFDGLKKK